MIPETYVPSEHFKDGSSQINALVIATWFEIGNDSSDPIFQIELTRESQNAMGMIIPNQHKDVPSWCFYLFLPHLLVFHISSLLWPSGLACTALGRPQGTADSPYLLRSLNCSSRGGKRTG